MDQHNNTHHEGEHTDTEHTVKAGDMAKDNKILLSVLSYLGPLVIVSAIINKDDTFVKFHIKQGLVLLSIEVILSILSGGMYLSPFWPIYKILHLALTALSIVGIIYVVQRKEKELPLVGTFAKYFTFID